MRALVLCAVLAALLPSGVGAQSLPLTEADALARLSANSPRVRAIRAAIDVARADVLSAARWPNPRITFDREAVAGITENMTMVSQELPINGARRLQVQASGALVEAISNRADDDVRRVAESHQECIPRYRGASNVLYPRPGHVSRRSAIRRQRVA